MSDGQDWNEPIKVTAKEWQKLEDPRFNDPLYVSGYSDGIIDEQERILKDLQDEYDYLFETYGSTIIKDELDLLLKIMEKITGIGHLKKRLEKEKVSAFEKRVELVEKWHTDLTKSLDDMYDLAEQVLDVWQEAEKFTEERIIKLLDAEIERIWEIKDYPATNALANIRAELIKGQQD